MEYKIAGYITVYEDKRAAINCLQAIQSQTIPVDLIIVIDNSQINLFKDLANASLLVHHFPSNVGIGQGIKMALDYVTRNNYQFLWTFDQDSIPEPNCLEILVANYERLSKAYNYEIGIIAPTSYDKRTNKIIESAIFCNDHFAGLKHIETVDFYECDAPITSGSLISISAACSIDSPSADLFIDGIDLDYGLRLRQRGFHNLIVTKAIMYHNFGSPLRVRLFNTYRYIQHYSALRHYYICRNHTYLETRYSKGFYKITSCMRRIKYLLSSLFWITMYDYGGKHIKIWACLLGTYHGLQGKLVKTW